MEWAAIVAIVLDLIRECMDKRSDTEVEQRLTNPGPLVAWALRRRLRDRGLRGDGLREAVRGCMTDLTSMEPEDIGALMADAKEED